MATEAGEATDAQRQMETYQELLRSLARGSSGNLAVAQGSMWPQAHPSYACYQLEPLELQDLWRSCVDSPVRGFLLDILDALRIVGDLAALFCYIQNHVTKVAKKAWSHYGALAQTEAKWSGRDPGNLVMCFCLHLMVAAHGTRHAPLKSLLKLNMVKAADIWEICLGLIWWHKWRASWSPKELELTFCADFQDGMHFFPNNAVEMLVLWHPNVQNVVSYELAVHKLIMSAEWLLAAAPDHFPNWVGCYQRRPWIRAFKALVLGHLQVRQPLPGPLPWTLEEHAAALVVSGPATAWEW